MLYLGDLAIEDSEVLRIARRGDTLTLALCWGLEDLPVLFDLPDHALLSWHGEDDPHAGIPVRTASWECVRSGMVLLVLLE